jgi:hypothetical protein
MPCGLSNHIWSLEEVIMMADNYLPKSANCGPHKTKSASLMGLISRAIDRLPKWAQWIVMVVGILCGIYGVARYGFWFLIKAIFSPDL